MEVISNITDFFVKLSMIFLGLLAVTHLLYLRFFQKVRPDSQSILIVMGLGLFFLVALPLLQLPYLTITLLALELAILWVYLLVSYTQVLEKNPGLILQRKNRTYLGCWVIATLVLAILLDQMQPLLHGAILFLLFVAGMVWLVFAFTVIAKVYEWVTRQFLGSIVLDSLLLAISVLFLHLLAYELFAEIIPNGLYYGCVVFSFVVFILGVVVMLNESKQQLMQQSLQFRDHHSLVYAYIAVLGYSLIETNFVAEVWEVLCWWFALLSLLTIEGLRLKSVITNIIRRIRHKASLELKYHRHCWLTVFSLASMLMFALNYFYQLRPDSYIAYAVILVFPFILLFMVLYQLTLNLISIYKSLS